MNAFTKLMKDIFSNKDFLDICIINGVIYKCIITNVENGIAFSDGGLVDEASFTIDLKLPLETNVKVNDIVVFNEKSYKISNIVPDSAHKSVKLYLVTLSKGIG